MRPATPIQSDDYLADSAQLRGAIPAQSAKPLDPGTLDICEQFAIKNPVEFYNTLTTAIDAALKEKPNTKALLGAQAFCASLVKLGRGDMIKIILVASILFKETLITPFSPDFPKPDVVERKLIAFYSDVTDAVNGRTHVTRYQYDKPEPTYAEMTLEVLQALGLTTLAVGITALASAETGLDYLKQGLANAKMTASQATTSLVNNLYSLFSSSESGSNDKIDETSSEDLNDADEISESWDVVQRERQPAKSPLRKTPVAPQAEEEAVGSSLRAPGQ